MKRNTFNVIFNLISKNTTYIAWRFISGCNIETFTLFYRTKVSIKFCFGNYISELFYTVKQKTVTYTINTIIFRQTKKPITPYLHTAARVTLSSTFKMKIGVWVMVILGISVFQFHSRYLLVEVSGKEGNAYNNLYL